MNPKSGKAGNAVAPAAPDTALDADIADPGEIAEIKLEQIKKKEGKYGATLVKPHKRAQTEQEAEQKSSWIEIEFIDEEDNPVPSEKYVITLPDGSVAKGTLDQNGFVRVDGIDPGTCQITFPDLDKDAWEPA